VKVPARAAPVVWARNGRESRNESSRSAKVTSNRAVFGFILISSSSIIRSARKGQDHRGATVLPWFHTLDSHVTAQLRAILHLLKNMTRQQNAARRIERVAKWAADSQCPRGFELQ
jgi:hypothetical protein